MTFKRAIWYAGGAVAREQRGGKGVEKAPLQSKGRRQAESGQLATGGGRDINSFSTCAKLVYSANK